MRFLLVFPHRNALNPTSGDTTRSWNLVHSLIKNNFETQNAFKTIKEIEGQNYYLTPARFIGIKKEEEESESYIEKMDHLTITLKNLFKKSGELEKLIRSNFENLGFEI